jgi:chromosome partitioning protein
MPALVYDRNSKGSVAYLALAGEILKQAKAEQMNVSGS